MKSLQSLDLDRLRKVHHRLASGESLYRTLVGGLAAQGDAALARVGATAFAGTLELVLRLGVVGWLRDQMEPGSADSSYLLADQCVRLILKDAHVNVVSVIDTAADFLWCCCCANGSPSIEAPERRRETLAGLKGKQPWSRQSTVENIGDWFDFVTEIRHSMVHKQSPHFMVFHLDHGLGFQVYDPEPKIEAKALLSQSAGGPVAEMSPYITWLIVEVMHFMDEVAEAVSEEMGVPTDRPGSGVPQTEELLATIRDLIVRQEGSR